MKKCLKCNKEYFDDSLFCPECGEQLFSNDTCPSCHKEVKPEDKYCRYCGRKIERTRVCSECGKQVDNDTNFCPQCGNKIGNDGFIVNDSSSKPSKKAEKSGEAPKLNQTLKYVFIAIFSVLAVLFVVGMFGDIYASKASISSYLGTSSQPINFFFGEGAKRIDELQYGLKHPDYYSFSLFEFVILNIFYFGGLVGLIVSLVFMIINFVKVITHKADLKITPIVGLAVSVLPYLFDVSFANSFYAKAGQSYIRTSFGWGTTILVVAVLAIIVALVAFEILANRGSTRKIFSTILFGFSSILTVCMVLFGHGLIVAFASSSETDTYNAGYYVRTFLSQYSSGSRDMVPDDFLLGLFGYVLILISGFTMISSTYLALLKKTISPLAFLSVAYVMFIVGSILSTVAFEAQTPTTVIGGGAIAVYVLGAFAIAGLIGRAVIERK